MKTRNFAIVASRKDIAGMNISSFISDLPKYFVEKDIINAENIDDKIQEDFIIFVSRHKGKQEQILSVHAPGNWKQAEYGGQEGKVCKTSASILKVFFQELNKNVPEGWQATLEVTHHGPYIEKPCLFIEIGSNEKDWKNKDAAKAIAKTIKEAIKKMKTNEKFITSIGIGGPHYCPNFNKIQLNSEYAIGHIIPEYSLPLTKQMIQEAVEKQEKPEVILLDWKGLGKSEQRKEIIEILDKLNLSYKRTSEV